MRWSPIGVLWAGMCAWGPGGCEDPPPPRPAAEASTSSSSTGATATATAKATALATAALSPSGSEAGACVPYGGCCEALAIWSPPDLEQAVRAKERTCSKQDRGETLCDLEVRAFEMGLEAQISMARLNQKSCGMFDELVAGPSPEAKCSQGIEAIRTMSAAGLSPVLRWPAACAFVAGPGAAVDARVDGGR